MKRIIICLLVFGVIFSFAACGEEDPKDKFSEFQGEWVYIGDIYESHLSIEGDFGYERFISNAVDDEWPLGLGLIEEDGIVYIYYSDDKKTEIFVSGDGTELYYQGRTYYKE